ncbi:MAG: winged helix-turn-helix transcriptional regulator [Erysipelotrichaceae bacterium]|nr:winged helix-turn-helix transcriptional regulator [Erysipelotrichaceae bacterium]
MEKEQINNNLVYTLSEFYKIMADYTRMKIIYALMKKELCVSDISEIVEMSQTAVSYQLRILRGARLVKHRREGKMIFYSLDDDHINDIINTTVMHLEHEE